MTWEGRGRVKGAPTTYPVVAERHYAAPALRIPDQPYQA